jgi:predicted dehydrogenase
MNRGIHVFSEKPMALTARQCDAMIAARDRNQVQLQVGQCLRFWPDYDVLLKAIQEKTYGKLTALIMTRIGNYPGWASENWFNDHRRSGGAILDLHLHDVDWVVHALGKPDRLTAAGTGGKTGGIDDVTALWEYADCVVTMKGSWKYQGFVMTFQAFFEDAAMDYGIHPNPALRVRRTGAKEDDILPVPPGAGHVKELEYFFACVRGEHPNLVCAAESTRDSVAMVELERKAIRTHRWYKPA